MKIYACGGAGINVAKNFESHRNRREEGFSSLDIVYIDASSSNVASINTDKDNVYLLEDTYGNVKEGGGKKRRLNYEDISARASEILLKYKPEKINVVIHSFHGGSGSVIGPVIVSNLLEKGNAVIVIGIGGSDSSIELSNTIDTINSYAAISKLRKHPVPCIYYENSKETPRGMVDSKIVSNIVMLSVFFSGGNHEMDYTDMYNFLNYNEVTDYSPKLSYLEFYTGSIEVGKGNNLISVATLSDASTPTQTGHVVEYQCTGFITNDVKEKLKVDMPIHLCVVDGVFNDILHRLKTLKDNNTQQRSALMKINNSIKPLFNDRISVINDGKDGQML